MNVLKLFLSLIIGLLLFYVLSLLGIIALLTFLTGVLIGCLIMGYALHYKRGSLEGIFQILDGEVKK